ncbi:hypothetical protein, partial [Vibrio hyugaensis]|uniref:hypothetical protein n=1 Tax=Vibrio hyugaensis TaxID=1534743 RepID=UPI001E546E3A
QILAPKQINTKTYDLWCQTRTNAFYTAICRLSGTLPPSFIPKEKCMLALIFMKQIENQYESVCSTTQLDGVVKPN